MVCQGLTLKCRSQSHLEKFEVLLEGRVRVVSWSPTTKAKSTLDLDEPHGRKVRQVEIPLDVRQKSIILEQVLPQGIRL